MRMRQTFAQFEEAFLEESQADAARLKLEYDFYYIKYFSIWLDFLIVLKTLQIVWSGFGSR